MARRAALIGRGRLICAVVGLVALTGCSSGYGDENRALAATVLELDAVTTTGEPVNESYCSQDSCWLGDDATTTSFELEVAGDVQDVADQLTDALPGWGVIVVDECDDPEADCGADNLIYAVRDGQLMQLLFDDDGEGQLLVDAGTTAVQTYN